MKVGDLVQPNPTQPSPIYDWKWGVIIGWDEDDDPIVWIDGRGTVAEYKSRVEVISASR